MGSLNPGDLTNDEASHNLPRLLDALYHFASAPEEHDSLFTLSDLMTDLMEDLVGAEDHPPEFLAAHIARAAAIAERVGGNEPERDNHVPANVITLKAGLVVKAAGREARDLLAPLQAMVMPGQGLQVRDKDQQAELEESVRLVEEGRVGFDVVQLGAGPDMRHLMVQKEAGVIISVLHVSQPTAVHDSVVAKHGITEAELRLLDIVQTGTGLKSAATELGISHNTARNQLSSIFGKLGVRRQAELVRHLTLLNLLATIGHQANRLPDDRAPLPGIADGAVRAYRQPETITLEDGRQLAYSVLGPENGQPILYLNSPLQAPILSADRLAELTAQNIRLIAVHRPGFGGSADHPRMSLRSFGADMAQLAHVLRAKMGVSRLPVLAISSAASFALSAAATTGAPIGKVGLVAPRVKVRGQNHAFPYGGALLFAQALKARSWAIQFGYTVMKARMSEAWINGMIDRIYAGSDQDLAYLKANPAVRDMIVRSGLLCFEADAAILAREVDLLRNGFDQSLSDIPGPVVAWHGGQDEINPAGPNRDALAGLDQLDYRILADDGHLLLDKYFVEIITSLVAPDDQAGSVVSAAE